MSIADYLTRIRPPWRFLHDLRGIRAIEANCNRRLHLKQMAGTPNSFAQEERPAISRRALFQCIILEEHDHRYGDPSPAP
jgi:hypothetical protein